MRMVRRALACIPKGHRILDVPCGWGRVSVELACAGYQVTAADLSEPMLLAAREFFAQQQISCHVEKQDIEKLSYADGSFDAVLCFRFFHHLPYRGLRRRVVHELCRVADRFVLLSYLNPTSVAVVQRRLRARIAGVRPPKHYTPLAEVAGYFRRAGFRLVADFALLRYLASLHLALFESERKVAAVSPTR